MKELFCSMRHHSKQLSKYKMTQNEVLFTVAKLFTGPIYSYIFYASELNMLRLVRRDR